MIQNVVATIGIFDGVHMGHKRILKRLVKSANRMNAKSLVVTFYPHPKSVLIHGYSIKFLTSLHHRKRLIKEMGVDLIKVIRFTKSLSTVVPEDFIKRFLLDKYYVKAIIVGEDFIFGFKRQGNFNLLKLIGKKYGFKVIAVKPVLLGNKPISSTRIREAIERGDFKNASFMLGRPVTVLGTVVYGSMIGSKIGFPTANIDPHHEAIPPSGVYAVRVHLMRSFYKGVVNIGKRPTFGKDKEPTIELHILNFKRDIYGRGIEIIFKRKIRDEKRFSSVSRLQRQIEKDIKEADI